MGKVKRRTAAVFKSFRFMLGVKKCAGFIGRKVAKNEADEVRIGLIKRHWTTSELARRCGIEVVTMWNQFSLGFVSEPVRYRIESVFAEPLWMGKRDWNKRLALARILGFDPFVEERKRLQARATALGVPYSSNRRFLKKHELIEKLERYLLK